MAGILSNIGKLKTDIKTAPGGSDLELEGGAQDPAIEGESQDTGLRRPNEVANEIVRTPSTEESPTESLAEKIPEIKVDRQEKPVTTEKPAEPQPTEPSNPQEEKSTLAPTTTTTEKNQQPQQPQTPTGSDEEEKPVESNELEEEPEAEYNPTEEPQLQADSTVASREVSEESRDEAIDPNEEPKDDKPAEKKLSRRERFARAAKMIKEASEPIQGTVSHDIKPTIDQSSAIKNTLNNQHTGSVGGAVSGQLSGDPTLRFQDISIGDELLAHAWTLETSPLRPIVDKLAADSGLDDYDPDRMNSDPDYRRDTIRDLFNRNPQDYIVTKHPVPNDLSSVIMTIKVHKGLDIHTNPVISPLFNQDFDGDMSNVAFHIEPMTFGRSRSVADYVLDHFGDITLEPELFAFLKWGDTENQKGLMKEALAEFDLSDDMINEISDAWTKLCSVDANKREAQFKSFIKTINTIAARASGREGNPAHTKSSLFTGILQQIQLESRRVMDYYVTAHGELVDSNKRWESLGYDGSSYRNARLIDEPTMNPDGSYQYSYLINEGSLPKDFEDLVNALRIDWEKTREKDGKTVNIYFRVPAAIAKEIRRGNEIIVGSSNASVIENTAYGLLTAVMSSEAFEEDSLLKSSTEARRAIVRNTGMPKNYASLGEFITNFARNNNIVAFEYNAGSIIVDQSMGIRQKKNATIAFIKEVEKYEQIRKAFIDCYGEYTLNALFGNRAENSVILQIWGETKLKDWINADLMTEVEDHDHPGKVNPGKRSYAEEVDDLLRSVLAQRSSSWAAFQKELNETLKKICESKDLLSNRNAWSDFSDMMFEVMSTLGGDVFLRRGYMSSEAFKNSDLYKRIMNLKGSPEQQAKMLKSYMFTELTEDMFADANSHYNSLLELVNRMNSSDLDATERMKLETAYQVQYSKMDRCLRDIGKQNIMWKNIARDWLESKFDIENGRVIRLKAKPQNSIVERILTNNTIDPDKKMLNVKDLFNRYYLQGLSCPFVTFNGKSWNPSKIGKVDFLDKDGNPLGNMHNTYILEQMMFEKMNQEHAGNNSAFKSNQALENVRAAGRKLGKIQVMNWGNIKKNVNDTLDQLIDEKGEAEVNRLIEAQINTEAPVTIDYQNFEAVLDFELSYGLSEKSKTAQALGAMFKQVCMAFNGKTISDANRVMDVAQQQMPLDDFVRNIPVIRYLLSHPDEYMDVYDPRTMRKCRVNKKKLLGKKSYVEFLRENPGLALDLRNHTVNIYAKSDTDTTAVVTATDSLYNSLSAEKSQNQIKNELFTLFADMPIFYAISKSWKNCSIDQAFDHTIQMIAKYSHGRLSPQKFVEKNFPEAKTRGEQDILDMIVEFLPELKEQYRNSNHQYLKSNWVPKKDFYFTPNFMHINSVLATAKTEDSTSVNGNTTAKINAPLIWLAAYTPEACDAEAREIPADEFFSDDPNVENSWRNLVGCISESSSGTNWIVDETTLDRIRKESPEGIVLIYHPADCESEGVPCCHHSVADRSTNTRTDMQSNALGRFLQVFRDKGTEKLNLKIAKTGDDGKNSISKLSVFNKDGWDAVAQGVKNFAALDLPEARIELAKWLKQVCSDLGYTMIADMDFINVAQIMIRKLPDGSFDVLSIEEISHFERNILYNYHDVMQDASTAQEIGEVCDEALKQFPGYGELPIQEVLRKITPRNLYSQDIKKGYEAEYHLDGVNQTMRPWMSSSQRNRLGIRKALADFFNITQDASVFDMSEDDRAKMSDEVYGKTKNSLPSWTRGYIINGWTSQDGTITNISNKGFGPRNLFIIESNNTDMLIEARMRRATVLVPDISFLKGVECKPIRINGGYVVNFLDQDINQRTTNGVALGSNYYTDDQLTYSYYDPLNEFQLGDAESMAFRSLIDKSRIMASDTLELDLTDIFKTYFDNPRQVNLAEVSFMSAEEVVEKLINGDEKEKLLFDCDERSLRMIDQYVNKFIDGHDDNGFLIGQKVAIGDVIGIIKAEKNGQTVYAPVTAFDLVKGKSGPAIMTINSVSFLPDTNKLAIDWSVNESLIDDEGNLISIKLFEGIEASMKTVLRTKLPEFGDHREFENGIPIGSCTPEFGVKARLTSSQRMKMKMNTLTTMMQSGTHGYNIADIDGTFPDNPELKQAVLEGRIDIHEWDQLLEAGNIQILPKDADPLANAKLNKILRNYLDNTLNPLLFLGSYFVQNGVATRHHIMPPRWSDLYDPDPDTTDALMKMYHLIDPTICPDGLDGDPSGCLFNNDLQLWVPYYGLDSLDEKANRVKAGQWVDVSVSQAFFDSEHNDVLRRPSVKSNSSSILADVSRTMMKQPILKSRLSTLMDFSLTQYDLGLPTESEATGVENLEEPQIDDSKIINKIIHEITAKIFPNGIPEPKESLSGKELAAFNGEIAGKILHTVRADDSLMRKLLSISSDESFFKETSQFTLPLFSLYHGWH